MRRREFIALLGGVVATWPLGARGQQAGLPVVGFVNGGAADAAARYLAAFRKGLSETGFVESRNVTVEYHWMEGRYDRIPTVIADLVRRQVAVIATPGSTEAALAAKTATSTIPIVFGSAVDPAELGLVTSLARPGGHGISIRCPGQSRHWRCHRHHFASRAGSRPRTGSGSLCSQGQHGQRDRC